MRIRTGYSFRTAAGSIPDVMSRLLACGYEFAPITDRASTFGYVRWTKSAKKAGLRPIYGIELAVSPDIEAKKPISTHWTFLATENLRGVHKLLKTATSQFRYMPLLTYAQAMAAEGVIKIAGSASLLEHMTPMEDLYIGLSPSLPTGLAKAAARAGYQFVACSDNKYPSEDDFRFWEILVGRGASTQTYPQHILSKTEWRSHVEQIYPPDLVSSALENKDRIAATCTASLENAVMLAPDKPKTLRQMCVEGAAKIGVDLTDKAYSERLDRELSVIDAKQFEDYFFIIADLMAWARPRLMCGPARGSSGGSLVCYLLEITSVDPLAYGLLFERFIDLNRSDLPDIDLDFSDQRRHLVFQYLEDRYGSERVARLGTVALYRARSSLSEIGGALKIPRWRTDAMADALPVATPGDPNGVRSIELHMDKLPMGRTLIADFPSVVVAARMEGHPRHHSQHAAGIVITDKPVTDYVAVDAKTGATHCDKKDAEDINLLKIDALGLTQLSVFEDAIEAASLHRNILSGIRLDDAAAFEVLNKKNFCGVFQFNGKAVQSISKEIIVESFADIVSITALGRPGPLSSGEAAKWAKVRRANSAPTYPHAAFAPILDETLGFLVYQEQVMRIGREIGGLSWEDVTALRKSVAKSLGRDALRQFEEKLINGAVDNGVPREAIAAMWEKICAFGAYGFNKSHAVAYAMVSYQCCWLKAHYPHEFAAATLQHEKYFERQILLLRELDDEGIGYIPVDFNLSTDRWTVATVGGKKTLVGPVNNVIGVGPKMVSAIVSSRARGEPFPERAAKLLTNAKTKIDRIWPIRDATKLLCPNKVDAGMNCLEGTIDGFVPGPYAIQRSVFCEILSVNDVDENQTEWMKNKPDAQKYKKGQDRSLKLKLSDDTGTINAIVGRFQYGDLARKVLDNVGKGRQLFLMRLLLKGDTDYRRVSVEQVVAQGDMNSVL